MKIREYILSGFLAAGAAAGFFSAGSNFRHASEYGKLAEEARLENDSISAKMLETEQKDAQEKGGFGAWAGIAFSAFAVIAVPRLNKLEIMMADYR